MTDTGVEVSEEQVLFFRARRGHLAGGGASDAVQAARAILGAQAQQEGPALLALHQRTEERPDAESLRDALFESPRLVRTWGQRGTVHIYDPDDWPHIVAARELWKSGGRRGAFPSSEELAEARAFLAQSDQPITRKDLYPHVPASLVESLSPIAAKARQEPLHFAAGRVIWQLSQTGEICTVHKIGNEQAYARRALWFPDLPWPEEADPLASAMTLTLRYLAVYGPATRQDVAHFFGANVSQARRWLQGLVEREEIVEVSCADRPPLWARKEDLDDLVTTPPSTSRSWPVRLLPLWESMLMGHADKSWTVPVEAERKEIWRKAAYVSAVVLARGRIVATWTHKVRRGKLEIQLTPLSGWQTRRHKAAVQREAAAIALHIGCEETSLSILS